MEKEEITRDQIEAFAANIQLCVRLVQEFENDVKKPLKCLLDEGKSFNEAAGKREQELDRLQASSSSHCYITWGSGAGY